MAGPGNLVTRRLPPGDTLPGSQVRDLACDTSTRSGNSAAALRERVRRRDLTTYSSPSLSGLLFCFHDRAPQSWLVSGWHVRTQMASAALSARGAPKIDQLASVIAEDHRPKQNVSYRTQRRSLIISGRSVIINSRAGGAILVEAARPADQTASQSVLHPA